MRKLLALVVVVGMLAVSFPYSVFGASYITITATGFDNVALPGPPTLTATLVSNTQVDLTWVAGVGATGTLIRAKYGSAPTTPADGYAVYTGAGLAATDWIPNIQLSDNTLWYSAWGYNGLGYSVAYDTASVSGGAMAAAIGVIGLGFLLLMGLGINGVAWWQKKWWICPISFFYFISVAYFCYSQSAAATGATTFDTYRMFTWVCSAFSLTSLAEMWYLYQNGKEAEEPEDDMVTKNRKRMEKNLAGTFNRDRPTVKRRPPGGGVGDGL